MKLSSNFAESTGLATTQTSGLLRLTPFQPTCRGGPCKLILSKKLLRNQFFVYAYHHTNKFAL